jgi:hypothetical protein
MQATALSLLSSQGQAVTLTPPPTGTYNPATRTFTGTSTPIQTVGVVLPLSRGLMHMPGTDIQGGDQQLLLPGNIAQPSVDAQVLANGKTYTIIEVNPVNPSGTPIYFDCIVRSPQ